MPPKRDNKLIGKLIGLLQVHRDFIVRHSGAWIPVIRSRLTDNHAPRFFLELTRLLEKIHQHEAGYLMREFGAQLKQGMATWQLKSSSIQTMAMMKPRIAVTKSLKTSKPVPTRGKPGRPARISREAILHKAMEILAITPVEEFKLKTVAEQLGTVTMAIYNYFGSREELLMAVADEVCLLFKQPKRGETWQDTLLVWLWDLKKHADHYPVIPSIIGINGHSSAGWVKMTVPITVLMYEQLGLRGKALALTNFLFNSTAISMIRVINASKDYLQPDAFPNLDELALDDKELAAMDEHRSAMSALKEKQIFDALFAQLIKGVETFI